MALVSSRSVLRQAASVARRDGPRTLLKAGLRRVNLSYEGYYYYANYRYKRFRGRPCVDEAAVFRTLSVDPREITRLPSRRFDKWANLGEIRSGDWDESAGRFEDLPITRALRERFESGRDWVELPYVRRAIETVESGQSTWNGCRRREDVHERCAALDDLFDTIREEGYKSQAELYGDDPKSLLLDGSFDRSRTDVVVHVGRNGDLLFVDGRHRLAIAKILGIEAIPVRVAIRHAQWQRIREAYAAKSNREARDGSHRQHPDIQDVLSDSKG